MPASKLKTEIARILKDEGYIANYKLTEEGTQKSIRIYLKYTPGNMPVISHIERVSRPGCRVYVGSKEVPARAGRPGRQYPDHAARRDDRHDRPQGRRRRRSAVPGLVTGGLGVAIMSRVGKKADSAAQGRQAHGRRVSCR